jgi:hypothetical protein
LVQDYLDRFGMRPGNTVLDPFSGTGTTLVECKKRGIASIGIEPNTMAQFASSVKLDWSVDPVALSDYASEVAVLLDAIDGCGDFRLQRYGRLALAHALVRDIGNLKFGPEVGVGKPKDDAPVIDAWLGHMRTIIDDLVQARDRATVPAHIYDGDARRANQILLPNSVDAVITSPPYPNEKDYTRTTRLESVILGMIGDISGLRGLKKNLIRSNARGVYKGDTDDLEVATHDAIQEIAHKIEQRRVEMGKTSGFERMYARVTKLYFGGMAKHFAALRAVLAPGARLAYVVGDQASYLRVMIRTGTLLADIAQSLGYRVEGIDLFRTRLSTATGEHLREEVVVLQWPKSSGHNLLADTA